MRRFALTTLSLTLLLASCLVAVAEQEDDLLDDSASEDFDEEDEDLLRQIEARHVQREFEKEDQMARELAAKIAAEHYNFPEDIENAPRLVDPCKGSRCGSGRICQANGNKAECVCIPECPEESDSRRKVCTNFNETWESACEVHRQRCLCNTDDPRCRGEEVKHVHIDYYGNCRSMPDCSENDLADFPRRMRDWLFNVMRDLAARNELPEAYMELETEAEANITKRWTNAAIWKWCDLDGHPNDNSVSLHELFPIRAPLMALEHCIAPFLESCDPNNDHRITLQEWGKCLELEEDDLTDRCAKINKEDELEKIELMMADAS
ncbi:SPARC [Toxorhynchites rutilus septentrionalis]|uniref:SPARC n=1 Tax=Toxorhynchites rutilus septentrionalis TaxID=329112 RepID=UPI002479D617|nr:SPARC [Toxorhynchites rutilus septentrionalis]